MSSREKYSDSKIDDILKEIGSTDEGYSSVQPNDDDIANILSELGMSSEKSRRKPYAPQKQENPPSQKDAVDKPKSAGANSPQNKTAYAENKEPVPQESPRRTKKPPAGNSEPTDIMDIKVGHVDVGRRAGKAAIMDTPGRVNRFKDDEKLASIFGATSDNADPEPEKPAKNHRGRQAKQNAEKQGTSKDANAQYESPQRSEDKERTPENIAANDAQRTQDFAAIPQDMHKAYSTATRQNSSGMQRDKEQMQRDDAEVGSHVAQQAQQEYSRYKDLDTTELLRMHNIETSTKIYKAESHAGIGRIPKSLETQRINIEEDGLPSALSADELEKLYIDNIVDDRFMDFFNKSVAITEEQEAAAPIIRKRKKKKNSSTGEFAILENKVRKIEDSHQDEDGDEDDYNHLKDAERIQSEIDMLKTSLYRRAAISGVFSLVMLWMGLGAMGVFSLPKFIAPADTNVLFAFLYLSLCVIAIVINYKTMLAGLLGLFTKATIETTPSLGLVAALVQALVLLFTVAGGKPVQGTLFGGIIMLTMVVHSLGKVMQISAIHKNFSFASSGKNYSAAYVLNDRLELAYEITSGLEEEDPALLLSRSTTLMKGFMRQSFSQRLSDRINRILGWIILAVAVIVGVFTWFTAKDAMLTISAVTAVFAFGVPVSSSLGAAFPSLLLQKNAAKSGAVVPGWSAMDALGEVNVVMAQSKDLFPPESVQVQKVTVYEHDSIDAAILYAASVLIEGCDTLREAFLEMVDNREDLLYPLDGIKCEPGRGFIAWANDSRVVLGSREMLQQNGVHPPPVKDEIQQLPQGCYPLYLVVSSRLLAMFAIEYRPDVEVDDVLAGLVKSGTSLLIESFDVNVSTELIEDIYRLPQGMVKNLGSRELKKLTPLTKYLPESEGVMAHLGGFGSLIGGMRAAFGASTAERLACYLQVASVILAGVLCALLSFNGGLATLSFLPILLYQLAWCVLISGVPFTRNY